MKTKLFIALALVMGLGIASADAQVAAGVQQRIRIAEGRRSGEITKMERHRLVKEQRRIHRHRRHAIRNDGKIGPREHKMLKREKRRADRHIYRSKHNRMHRKG